MNPGVELAQWLQVNIAALFSAILAVFGIIVLVKKKIIQGVILLIVGALGAIFVFNGIEFVQKLSSIVLSWFN